MSSLATDWRNYSRGVLPTDDWAPAFSGGAAPTGWIAGTDLEPGDCLELYGEAVAMYRALAWTIWDGQTGRGTQEALGLFYIDTAGASETPLIFLRMGGTPGAENGYYVTAGGTVVIHKLTAGVLSSLGSSSPTMTTKRYWWVRSGATGTTIRVKVWALGSAEPGAWSISATDAAFSDGQIGIGVYDASTVTRCHFFSVGVNGTAAPDQSSLPTRLRDVIADPAGPVLEHWLRLSYADPTTGVVYARWVSQQGRGRTLTGDLDFPPNQQFFPILSDAGIFSSNLSEDIQFSGRVAETGAFEIRMDNRDGALAFLGQPTPGLAPAYTLAGLRQTVYAGEAGGSSRGFEPLFSATCVAEPVISAIVVLQVASNEDRLDDPIRIGRYAGVRTCQRYNGGSASAAYLAAYDVTEFVVMVRFRVTGTPTAGTFPLLIDKSLSATNRNFQIFMVPTGAAAGTPGGISGITSVGGVGGKNRVNSAGVYATGTWWIAAYAHSGVYGNYLLISNGATEELVTGLTDGAPNTQAAPVAWGTGLTSDDVCDHRIYNYYLTPDQVRAEMDKLASVSSPGLVAAWVGDDGLSGSTPTTVTDYGSGANNAAITGAFTWVASDLGDVSQAGKTRPIVYGAVRQMAPDRSDPARSRYTYNDGEVTGNLTTKSRGAALTRGTDFSSPPSGGTDTSYQGGGVFLFLGANPDPVTVDFTGTGSVFTDTVFYPSRIARSVLTGRGSQILHRDIDDGWCEAAARLAPYLSGYWLKGGGSPPSQADALGDVLGSAGQAWRLDRDDRVAPCELLPTVCPGPYGDVHCLEFTGHPRSELLFPSVTIPAGSHTVCGWVKCFQVDPDMGATNTVFPRLMSILTAGDTTSPLLAAGLYPYTMGQLVEGWASGTTFSTSTQNVVPWATWVFVACVFTQGTGWSFYSSRAAGGTLALTNSPPFTLATFAGGTGDVRIGCGTAPFIGALQHVQIWSAAKNLSQLQALMATPPVGSESGLVLYAPLTESSGAPVDAVSGKLAQWGNVRRSPRVVLDYTVSGDSAGKYGGPMPLRPAHEVVTKYGVAGQALQEADIATSVTGPARQLLKEPEQEVRYYSPAVAFRSSTGTGYRRSRSIPLSSRFYDQKGAAALSALTGYRFSPARSVGEVLDALRLPLDAQILDEAWVRAGSHTGLPDAGLSYRIIRMSKTFQTGLCTLGLWR